MTQKTVSLDVSRDGLVSHMRDQFVHSDTFLREILQNARRAGASQIEVQFNPDSRQLVIADNGRGIAAPEDLFILGRSGFRSDSRVDQREKPFGMGFVASLFAASFIAIQTRNFSCEFNTEAALNFGSIAINADLPGLFFEGTRVELTLSESRAKSLVGVSGGFSARSSQLFALLRRITSGFAVPVKFNGEELPRIDALNDEFVEHSGLRIRVNFPALAEARQSASGFTDARCYFQGLPLTLDSRYLSGGATVIHVTDKFRVRTPDRDTIVDEQMPDFLAAKRAALADIWREYLEQAKQDMHPETFVLHWGGACRTFAPTLLNDLPLAPAMYDVFTVPPRHERYSGELNNRRWENNTFLPVGSPVVSLDTSYLVEDELERSVLGLYACLKGYAVVDPNTLPDGHWARETCVSLDALEPSIQAQGIRGESHFSNHQDQFEVVFCDHYTLDPRNGDEAIEVYDWPVWDTSGQTCKLLIPSRADPEQIEDVLLQRDPYMVDDCFMEREFDADRDRLSTTARLMFGDECSVLSGYLEQQLGSVCDALRGRRFTVEIDHTGNPTVMAA